MIQICFEKKDLWLFFSFATFLVAAGYALAWGSNNPSIHGHDAGEIEGINPAMKTGITWLKVPIIVAAVSGPAVPWTNYTNIQFANKTVLLKATCAEAAVFVNPSGVNNKEVFNEICLAGNNENDVGVGSVWVGSDGTFQYSVVQTDPPLSYFSLNITAYMG